MLCLVRLVLCNLLTVSLMNDEACSCGSLDFRTWALFVPIKWTYTRLLAFELYRSV